MRAVLASVNHELNAIIFGSNNSPTAIFEYTGDMQKDAEAFARMFRYLAHIAPIMPPAPLPQEKALQELPAYTKADLARAQVFTSPGIAYGSGISKKAPRVSNEAFLDALGELEL